MTYSENARRAARRPLLRIAGWLLHPAATAVIFGVIAAANFASAVLLLLRGSASEGLEHGFAAIAAAMIVTAMLLIARCARRNAVAFVDLIDDWRDSANPFITLAITSILFVPGFVSASTSAWMLAAAAVVIIGPSAFAVSAALEVTSAWPTSITDCGESGSA